MRDIDVLRELSARTKISVYLSVPSIDDEAWRRLEPGTAPPLQRLRAVRALTDAGIHCGVLMAPLVPGITTRPSIIEATVKACADHGARSVGAMVLHLEAGVRSHFLQVIAREYPQLRAGYERLYTKKYAPSEYTGEVGRIVSLAKARYGVRGRPEPADAPTPEGTRPPRQAPLRFVRR